MLQKGDYIDQYRVTLAYERTGIETYRVKDPDGYVYVLKRGVPDAEISVAPLTPLYACHGADYVVYRHVNCMTIRMLLACWNTIAEEAVTAYATSVLSTLDTIHNAGWAHTAVTVDNVIIDSSKSYPQAWLLGLSHVTPATPAAIVNDLRAVGCLLLSLVSGVITEDERPKMPNINGIDTRLLDIIANAVVGEYKTSRQMLDALQGRSAVVRTTKPMGPGFDAVAGMDEIKRRLQEDVIDILADREGAERYGITIPNGMLLYGPPGCGKSFIAERFAEQASYNYRYVKSSDLASTYIHGSQEKIGLLFDEARRNAPTILCFDEFDALVPRRDDINNASHSAEVNEFLTQLNNCGRDGVFVIATTNRPDRIDSAVLRTGRIDYMVYVPVPDKQARAEMLRLALAKRPVADDIDYQALADITDGYLASDISTVVQEAARQAFRTKSLIDNDMMRRTIAQRKPSLSPSDIRDYEALRQRFESRPQTKRSSIGFV